MTNTYFEQKILGLFVKTNGLISKYIYGGFAHILAFHRMNDSIGKSDLFSPNKGLSISTESMDLIVKYYESHSYSFVSLDELHEIISKKKSPKKCIAITFDDGYADNYNIAFNYFINKEIPVTYYIANSFPSNKALLWWYALEELLKVRDKLEFIIDDKPYSFECKTGEQKNEAFAKIRALILQSADNTCLQKTVSDTTGKNTIELLAMSKSLCMNWEEIKVMSQHDLVTIGAHTMNHLPLSKISKEEALAEIIDSKQEIEKYINKTVNHFAYPYGSRNEISKGVRDIVESCGFKTATTLIHGNIIRSKNLDALGLPRICIAENAIQQKLEEARKGISHVSFNGLRKTI